jgi:hypothetical protein
LVELGRYKGTNLNVFLSLRLLFYLFLLHSYVLESLFNTLNYKKCIITYIKVLIAEVNWLSSFVRNLLGNYTCALGFIEIFISCITLLMSTNNDTFFRSALPQNT